MFPRLAAGLYDAFLGPTEAGSVRAWRQELLADLAGDVLEVGAGTGANLAHYPDGIDSLVVCEPDRAMRDQLEGKRAGRAVSVSDAPVTALPAADGSLDAVVCTLVLCTVPDPAAGLAEIRRVLRPGGRLVFIEHVGAPLGTWTRRVQAALEPAWRLVSGDCHLCRDTGDALVAAGFDLQRIRRDPLRPAPGFIRPAIRGVAVKPAGG